VIRYEIVHNNIKYLFSTKQQICDEFNLTINVVMRLINAHHERNNHKPLLPGQKRLIETYPKFTQLTKLKVDKSKKIIDVIRSNKDETIESLSMLTLKIECPSN
jgi:hypothetical protein